MRGARFCVSVLIAALGGTAWADPITLRMAGVGPEGTAWAREVKAFARDVETATNGEVTMKWYLGGIAGSEMETLERIKKNQLDGAGGAAFCPRLAPSLRVFQLPGLLRDTHRASQVLSRLYPVTAREFERNDFVVVAQALFGSVVLFSRAPVASADELGRTRFWLWELDEGLRSLLPQAGMSVVPAPLGDATRLYEEGKTDGFISAPAAALAFQWSARSGYYSDLPIGYLPGCAVIARRAFDSIPFQHQRAIRAAGAKLSRRIEDVLLQQEAELLGGLFERQGVHRVPASNRFRDDFYTHARLAWERDNTLVPTSLVQSVLRWIAEDEPR
jgi:TRAP-type C4-dicarboxylate transport system substrate-binding protein